MLKHALCIAILIALTVGDAAFAQQAQPTVPAQPEGKPQVKINYLNVCTPGKEEQEIINNALAAASAKPVFSTDFEISRGRTTMKDAPESKFVRLRRDFAAESPLITAQYSMSADDKTTIEILVLRPRDPKDFLEIVMEDRVSSGAASPVSILATDTPANRVRVERLGKSSAVLTRCAEVDQSAYDQVFHQASEVMAQYRSALGLRTAFRSDIAWLSPPSKTAGDAPRRKQQPKAKP